MDMATDDPAKRATVEMDRTEEKTVPRVRKSNYINSCISCQKLTLVRLMKLAMSRGEY